MKNRLLLTLTLFLCSFFGHAQIITTVAGAAGGFNFSDSIPATDERLQDPTGVAVDNAGNFYIAERAANKIRKVDASGIITTIAGTGTAGYSGDGGPATAAELNWPYDLTLDAAGNIYFSDDENRCIRKISTSGIITTVAGNDTVGYSGDGGPATLAELHDPSGLAVDNAGDLFIADNSNHRIRKVDASGIITTVAGNGSSGYNGDNIAATTAELNKPNDVKIDAEGNVYIVDASNYRIRKVNTSGIITTIAGTGILGYSGDNDLATNAKLYPGGINVDDDGNVYIGDSGNNRIRKINNAGIITTIAGNGTSGYAGDNGPATNAELSAPVGIAFDNAGGMLIADYGNGRIRRVSSVAAVNTPHFMIAGITVYPNPNQGTFVVNVFSDINKQLQVYILNMAGEKVQQLNINTNIPQYIHLDVPAGFYFLTVTDGHNTATQKIAIIK